MFWHLLISKLTTDRNDYTWKMVTTDMMTLIPFTFAMLFVITNRLTVAVLCVNYNYCLTSFSAWGVRRCISNVDPIVLADCGK
jgi:hypothetical protein